MLSIIKYGICINYANELLTRLEPVMSTYRVEISPTKLFLALLHV